MTTFGKAKRKLTAPRIVKASPDWFEPNWPQRPDVDVAIGLRLLSVREIAEARMEAEREASGVYDEHPEGVQPIMEVLIEQYNEILLCEALARATCSPNNVTQPYFDQATITIRSAITSEGLRRLWDEYLILSASYGILKTELTDEEIPLLVRALRSKGVRARLTQEDRKLLAHVLANVRETIPDRPDGDELDDELHDLDQDVDDDEDGQGFMSGEESVYVARTTPT